MLNCALIVQAYARPISGLLQPENRSTENNQYQKKKVRMRKWLCCSCQVEETNPATENEHLKSPSNFADG